MLQDVANASHSGPKSGYPYLLRYMISCVQRKVAEDNKEGVQEDFAQRRLTVARYQLCGNAPHADPDQQGEESLLHVIADVGLHLPRGEDFNGLLCVYA